MIEIKSRWKSVTDNEKWAARGASFVAKVKATKMVWFPPRPGDTGKKAASHNQEGDNEDDRCRQEGDWQHRVEGDQSGTPG